MSVQTGPLQSPGLPHFHWHLELRPNLLGQGGFEQGSGCAMHAVSPEVAAAHLRSLSP